MLSLAPPVICLANQAGVEGHIETTNLKQTLNFKFASHLLVSTACVSTNGA
jgi:hypothetical protein